MSIEQPNNNTPGEDKWEFASEEDQVLGIETCRYENGQTLKRVKLSDGRIAIARRMKGKDAKFINRKTGGDTEKFQNAMASECVEIDGKKLTPEELDELWYEDYTNIMSIASVNFSLTQKA